MLVGELMISLGIKPDKSLKQFDKLLSSLTTKAAAFGAGIVYSLERMIDHATESASHFVSLSQAMGMSIRQAQEWDYVAQQSGSNLKEFATGLSMFQGNLRKFATGGGGKQVAQNMRELGLSATDAKLAMSGSQGMEQVLMKVADRVKALGNTPETGALVQALFGKRAGRAMVADLARGSEGIRELQDHFRKLGAEITHTDAMQLRGLGNSIKDAKLAINGLINQSLAFASPLIQHLTDDFIKFINVPENRRKVMEMFADVLRGIANIAPTVGKLLWLVAEAIAWLGDHVWVLEAAFAAIVAIKGITAAITVGKGIMALIAAFQSLTGAATKAGAAVAATQAAGAGSKMPLGVNGATSVWSPAALTGAAAPTFGSALVSAIPPLTIAAAAATAIAAGGKAIFGEAFANSPVAGIVNAADKAKAEGRSLGASELFGFDPQNLGKSFVDKTPPGGKPDEDQVVHMTVSYGDTNYTISGVNATPEQLMAQVKQMQAEHESNRNREAIEQLGARGRRQK
jgi:hypothetical protein